MSSKFRRLLSVLVKINDNQQVLDMFMCEEGFDEKSRILTKNMGRIQMKNYLEKIADDLYLVIGEKHGRFPHSHGMFIDSTRKVLVDTGFGSSRAEAINSSIDIDIIINTHYHLDHTRDNRFFPEAEFWTHPLEEPPILSSEVFYSVTGLDQLGNVPNYFRHYPTVKKISRRLSDGDILDFGGVSLEVIHTPGHTPGHICLYEPKKKILFAADIDLTPFGPWYGNPTSDIDAFSASIDRLIELKPNIVVSSHSGIITDSITDRLREYQGKITARDNAILELLKTKRKLNEILCGGIIYPPNTNLPEGILLFEKMMVEKHVSKLAKEGKLLLTT